MTTPAWYFEWAQKHCIAFGFGDTQAETVAAWGPVFGSLFRPDELAAATGHLLASPDAPKFASDHRGAIMRAVEAIRRRGTAKAADSNLARGCIECGGCGLVVVPHPGMADDADPPRWNLVLRFPAQDPRGLTRTTAVACVLCPMGQRTREEADKQGRPLMTISQYEHMYPNWRAVQAKRNEVLAAGRLPPSPEDTARLNKLLAEVRQRDQRRAG